MRSAIVLALFLLAGCAPRVELTDEQFDRIITRLDAIEEKQGTLIESVEQVQSSVEEAQAAVEDIDCSE